MLLYIAQTVIDSVNGKIETPEGRQRIGHNLLGGVAQHNLPNGSAILRQGKICLVRSANGTFLW
jgi:hypothetical protein